MFPGSPSGTIVWRTADGEDEAIAAHRVTDDETAAIVDLVNAKTIRTLASRAHDARARRGLAAAIRQAGFD